MADHLVERGADGLGVRRLAVAKGSWNGPCLFVQLLRELVERLCRHPRLCRLAKAIEDLGCYLTGLADLCKLFRGFEPDFVLVSVPLSKRGKVICWGVGVVALFPFEATSAPTGVISRNHEGNCIGPTLYEARI